MCRSRVVRIVITCTVAIAAAGAGATHALAQNISACSPTDQELISNYSRATLGALMASDLARYRKLSRELPGKLSPACRTILSQVEPMRVKCTEEEKETVLEHYQAVLQAALGMDAMGALEQMQDLEESLSPPCWLAVNRHVDPRVQNACSAAELDHLATFAGPVLRATAQALSTYDPAPLLQLVQAATALLSPNCTNALARFQQEVQRSPNRARQYEPSNVLDHGGGTYSVPGLGACTPSGCMAY